MSLTHTQLVIAFNLRSPIRLHNIENCVGTEIMRYHHNAIRGELTALTGLNGDAGSRHFAVTRGCVLQYFVFSGQEKSGDVSHHVVLW
jgi:hypothetical protein